MLLKLLTDSELYNDFVLVEKIIVNGILSNKIFSKKNDLVSKRGFRPAEGSKVRNLAYNGSPNDFDRLILNLPEVLRGSELLYCSGEIPMQCNKTI